MWVGAGNMPHSTKTRLLHSSCWSVISNTYIPEESISTRINWGEDCIGPANNRCPCMSKIR
jgi:hypothetical protein